MTFKAYLINLDRNPERLAFMSKQLEANTIAFERENAIDGKEYNFSSEYNDDHYKRINSGATMSLGERGCALSHKHALERMLKDNCDYALIMEDDVELPTHFKKVLDDVLTKRFASKTSWEYLSFNYPSVGYKAIILWLFLFFTMFSNKKGNRKYLTLPIYFIKFLVNTILFSGEGLREWLYKKIYTFGTPAIFIRPLYLAGCYIVTREGAQKLLRTQGPLLSYTADRLPNVARVREELKFYAFSPLLVIQRRDQFQSNSVDPDFDAKVKSFMGGRLLRE